MQVSDAELMLVDVLSSRHRQEWEHFLTICQESTFFHTVHSKELLEFGGGDVLYWGLWLDDRLEAIWPTSLLPCFGGTMLRIIRPPAVTQRIDLALFRKMLAYISDAAMKKKALRWSGDMPERSHFLRFASQCGFGIEGSPYWDYIVNTNLEADILWKRLGQSARTAVRRATKQGLEVREAQEPEELSTFFSIYRSTMERRQVANYFPLNSSLIPLLTRMIRREEVKLFTASDGNRMVAGILLLLHKRTALWWLGGSLQDSWKMRPNELLVWHAIEWASKSRFSELDLGWAGMYKTGLDGLQLFKRHLGGQRVNLVHLALPINRTRDLLTTTLVRIGGVMHKRGLIPKHLLALASRNRWFG